MNIDTIIITVYLIAINVIGLVFSRVKTIDDYFLGSRSIPWAIACFSIVATETSTLTFISVPGVAYLKGMGFLQIALGYIIGRIIVAALLLPRYFSGTIETVYQFLHGRFGISSRRIVAIIFHATRLLADSARLFVTAIPLAMLLKFGSSYGIPILIIAAATLLYTLYGGIRSVALVDSIQFVLYLICAIAGVIVISNLLGLSFTSILSGLPDKSLSFITIIPDDGWGGIFTSYNIFSGILGGGLLSLATHGTDHLLVQRVLSCKNLKSAKKAMIMSGLIVFAQFALFLLLGIFIKILLKGAEFKYPDEIIPHFIINYLPAGLKGLMLAGIFAAAMSTLSSSINSLSASTALDILGISSKDYGERKKLRLSRLISLFWTLVLVVLSFLFTDSRSPLVEIVLGISAITGGGILGMFMQGVLIGRINEKASLAGVVTGILITSVVAILSYFNFIRLLWPWYTPIGFIISFFTGIIVDRFIGTE